MNIPLTSREWLTGHGTSSAAVIAVNAVAVIHVGVVEVQIGVQCFQRMFSRIDQLILTPHQEVLCLSHQLFKIWLSSQVLVYFLFQ